MTAKLTVGRIDATDFAPLPAHEGGYEPIDGDPDAQVHTLFETEELWSGLALIQPCTFRYPVEHLGSVHLIEGDATITTDGVSRTVAAGDVLYLTPGAVTTWEVISPIREFFVVRLDSRETVPAGQ